MANEDPWKTAKSRFKLTDRQVAMAKELGMNPKKLGKAAPNHHEPWKDPLGVFIERCHYRRFGGPKDRS